MTGKRKKHSTTNLRTKQFSLSRNNASAAACKWAPSMQQSVQADHYRSLFQGVPLQLLEAEIVCLSSLRGGFPISSVYFYCSWHLRGARLPQHRHHRPRNSVSRVKKRDPVASLYQHLHHQFLAPPPFSLTLRAVENKSREPLESPSSMRKGIHDIYAVYITDSPGVPFVLQVDPHSAVFSSASE